MITAEQRTNALAHAQAIRLERTRFKREVAAGRLDLRLVLDDLPPCCARAKLYDVVQWLPRVGHSKAYQILRQVLPGGIVSETITLERLSPTTKAELVKRIDRYYGGSV